MLIQGNHIIVLTFLLEKTPVKSEISCKVASFLVKYISHQFNRLIKNPLERPVKVKSSALYRRQSADFCGFFLFARLRCLQ